MSQLDIGLIGLAVMGQNLVLNLNDHGFKVAVFNRTTSVTKTFIDGPAKGTGIVGCDNVESFVDSLAKPRVIMLMVKAGSVVDRVIEELVPLLDQEDIIVDGGIKADNVADCAAQGANAFVAGTSVYSSDDITAEIHRLRRLAQDGQQ